MSTDGDHEPCVEAVLTYRTQIAGKDCTISLGATDEVRVLRALRDALVERARQEALDWMERDAGVFAVKLAEFERLLRVLSVVFPDEHLRPSLRVVK